MINPTFTKVEGKGNTLTCSNPSEKGVSREWNSQNVFLESKRERENVKSDFKMPSCQLIHKKYYPFERQCTHSSTRVPARAQRNPLEREKHACRSSAEHQNTGSVQSPLEHKKTRSSGPPENWATKN